MMTSAGIGEEVADLTNQAEDSIGIYFPWIQAWWIDVVVLPVSWTIEAMGLSEKVLVSSTQKEGKNSKAYP